VEGSQLLVLAGGSFSVDAPLLGQQRGVSVAEQRVLWS
jgi:hypothetical protein